MPRRGENIYKRKDGRWEARYVKQILPDGTKKYGSVYARTYSEVKQKQQSAKTAPQPIRRTDKNLTLLDVYTLWIEGVRLNSKPNTIMKYVGIFNNHISCLQNMPVAAIDRGVIFSFTETLVQKGLCNKTVNDILTVLHLILGFAAEEFGIDAPRITYLREEHKEPRYLTLNEQKALAQYLTQQMDVHKFGTLLAMYTGIRIGELCALRWEDVSESYISINKTMMRVIEDGKSEVVVLPPKSKSSVRIIPLPRELQKHCRRFRAEGYVLSTDSLEFTEPRYMQKKFEKYVADCELRDVTFHTLRHTFATRCVEAGVDAKTVSELLGHTDTTITLNRYVHSSLELKQDSIEKMQNLLA